MVSSSKVPRTVAAADPVGMLPAESQRRAGLLKAKQRTARTEERRLVVIAASAVGGVLAVILAPLLAGRVYSRDELGWALISRVFYRNSLISGEAFDWWPGVDGGFYIHGIGAHGLYHPLHLIGYWLLPLPWSFDLEVFLGYPLQLIGFTWLLRRWHFSRSSALFGGSLFSLCGFSLLHHVHTNVVWVAAHIPFMLVMLDVILREASPRRRIAALSGLALLTGSQLLLHFPQIFIMSVQLEIAYCLLVGLSRGTLRRALPGLVGAKLLGASLGAVQLLPSWEYIQYTIRAETSLAFRYTLSLPVENLLQLFSPFLFVRGFWEKPGLAANLHEYGIYDGAVPLALAIWVLVRIRVLESHRRAAWALIALLLVGLDLSLGAHGFLYHVQVHLPVVGLFRAPCRNILLVHLALAGLGALAFEDLRTLRSRRESVPWRALWPLALAPALSVAVAVVASSPALLSLLGLSSYAPEISSIERVWAGPFLCAAAALLVVSAARGGRCALPLLIIAAAADLGFYGVSYIREQPAVAYRSLFTPLSEPALPEPAPGYRIHGGATSFRELTPNVFTLWGYRVSNAYSNVPVRRELNYTTETALRLAGVQWIYKNYGPERELMTLPDPMPRVRLVTRVLTHDHPARVVSGIDIATTAIVPAPVLLELGPRGIAELVEDRPGRIRVRTDTPGRQLLILNENHLAGWQVSVDGQPASLIPVYGDFMGCVVDGGQHDVVFLFAPDSLKLGRRISLAGLLAVAGLTAFGLVRAREKP